MSSIQLERLNIGKEGKEETNYPVLKAPLRTELYKIQSTSMVIKKPRIFLLTCALVSPTIVFDLYYAHFGHPLFQNYSLKQYSYLC